MRKFLAVAVVGMTMMLSMPAVADTFVWQDSKGDFTMSFPDSWRIQTEDTPTTSLRIAGPLAEDLPTCRMQVDTDGRTKIYPKYLLDEAVVETLDEAFWERHIGQYERSKIAAYYAPASMSGKGDATAIKFVFAENGVPMYGVMIGSIYADKKYIASCSAKLDMYDRWAPVFASILDSVELKSKYHPFATGYYRDFLADPVLALPRVKPGSINAMNSYWFADSVYNQ